ncbi:MAG: DegT/DnrJ/EryC1/StrS family aminotransferase, partial [Candidatus Aminicenantes bacterium]|nr:DegT/DnrJ/EryC1/StrS family aminotransferase [Candidatus Aminicenantes bacterium]
FPAIHLQPFYRKLFGYRAGDFPLTERAADRTIALPFFNRLTEAEVDAVCRRLIASLRSAGRAGYARTRRGGR